MNTQTNSVTQRDLNRTVTLTYTVKVPLNFAKFVELLNDRIIYYDDDDDEHDELTAQDDDAKKLWKKFLNFLADKGKVLPSGAPVDVVDEVTHESVYPLVSILKELYKQEQKK